MRKSNGFTLVEIIIALTLIVAIGLIVMINFNRIFNKKEEMDYTEYVNKIKSAADFYLSNNTILLSEINTNRGFIEIELKDLVDNGLISSDLKNPETGISVDNPNNNEFILVTLDDAGTVKFTYPGEKKGNYLQTLNKVLDYNSEFECISEEDLDTVNLAFIDNEGKIVTNYFNENPNRITCKTNELDTTKFGTHLVKYSYVTPDGVTKEGTRNFIVIDPLAPTVSSIQSTPNNWTKDNITITATITDNESGIAAYSINLNNCGNFTITSENQVSAVVSTNGTYSVCAKDVFGNIKEEKITITKIDKNGPSIADITKNTNEISPSITINTTITDNDSGIIAYAINQSSSTPTTWTNISTTASKAVSQTITANGTYYVWAKDAVGNVSSKSIQITTIATLYTKSFSTGELSSSTYNGTYNTGVVVKGIKSITVNNGQVTSYSYSGNNISYTLKNGSAKTRTTSSTCTTSATISYYCSAVELVLCKSTKCCWDSPYEGAGQVYGSAQTKYTCPSGYTLSGSTCSRSCSSSYTYYKYTVTVEYYA